VLQDRFESRRIGDDTHACFGVYVIDGRVAGVYARVGRKPLIDTQAQDAAVLLDAALDIPVAGAAHVEATHVLRRPA
jgi:hypothetical protein